MRVLCTLVGCAGADQCMPSSSAAETLSVQSHCCRCACCREVERDEGMVKLVKDIQGSDPMASALLIECRGRTPEALEVRQPTHRCKRLISFKR